MVQAQLKRYGYTLDARDKIVSVDSSWLAFALENGVPELTKEAVIGKTLWQFIDGAETIELYQAVFQRVRSEQLSIVIPFRCDSPTLRRCMRLEVLSQPEGRIQLYGIVERVEPTRCLNLLDPNFPRSHDILTVCSCCLRALVEPYGWLEVEDALVRLHLMERSRAPNLRHRICPLCLANAARMPAS